MNDRIEELPVLELAGVVGGLEKEFYPEDFLKGAQRGTPQHCGRLLNDANEWALRATGRARDIGYVTDQVGGAGTAMAIAMSKLQEYGNECLH